MPRLSVLLVILIALAAAYVLRTQEPSPVSTAERTAEGTAKEAARLLGRGDGLHHDGDEAKSAGGKRSAAEDGADEGKSPWHNTTIHVHVHLGEEPAPAGVLVMLGTDDAFRLRGRPWRWEREAVTDESGTARFEGVNWEHGSICAWCDGCAPTLEYWWWHEAGEDEPLSLTLKPGLAFDGRVVDAATEHPIPGASVLVDSLEVGPTDETGTFHVPGVDEGVGCRLIARAPGYVACVFLPVFDSGRVHPALPVLRMQRGGVLTGTVRSATGELVAQAEVRVSPRAPHPGDGLTLEELMLIWRRGDRTIETLKRDARLCVRTDAHGVFRAHDIEFDKAHDVTACAEGHADSAVSSDVRVTESVPETSLRLTLRRHGRVVLRAVASDGARLPSEARVRVIRGWHPYAPDEEEAPGRFVFGAVDPGVAYGFIDAEGFLPAATPIEVRGGETVEAEIRLEAGARIEGLVVGPDGEPVPDATVRAAAVAQNLRTVADHLHLSGARSVSTDREGRFAITGLPPGEVFVIADDGYEETLATPQRVRCTAPAHDVRLVLAHRGGVRVRLLTQAGAPYAGHVSAWIHDADGSGLGHEDPPVDGVIVFSGLADGDYTLTLTPSHHAWMEREVRIRGGAMLDCGDVVIDDGVTVSGSVVDETGAPVRGVEILCEENDERQTLTDEDGRFSMDAFPDGGFTLYAEAPAHVPADVEVQPSATTGLRIVLLRAAHVRGVATSPRGAVRAGGWIEFRLPGASGEMYEEPMSDGTMQTWVFYEGSEYLRVGEAGRFEGDVRPGSYVGWLRDEAGGGRRLGEWTFKATKTYEIEVVLPAK